MQRRAWFALSLLGPWALPAGAQEGGDDPIDIPVDGPTFGTDFGGDFAVNSVLVASFEAVQPFLDPEAQRVRGLVEGALAQGFVVLTMKDVPAFADYTADVYLRSCPEGQYIGCVFVVGGRAKTDWTIGGRVSAVDGGYRVDLSFIDVAKAKLEVEMDVVLDGRNDAQFQEGVLKLMDALVKGEVKQIDVRADPEAAARAKAEEDKRKADAERFAVDSVYEDPDAIDRGEISEDAQVRGDDPGTGRITSKQLAEMEDRGGLTPWDRAGLKKGQYKLYRNSGLKLDTFRDRLLGRKGQFIIRLGGTFGSGPWGQQHETIYLVDGDTPTNQLRRSDIPDQSARHGQVRAVSYGFAGELAVGLTPWLELGFFGNVRLAPFSYRFDEERTGVDDAPPDPTRKNVSTLQGGLRIGAVPFPAYPLRPTLHVGASLWYGTSLQKQVVVPTFLAASATPRNYLLFVHVQPGAEVSAGKWVTIWTRFDLDIPVYGRAEWRYDPPQAQRVLSPRAQLDVDSSFGLGGTLGVAIHLPVGPQRKR